MTDLSFAGLIAPMQKEQFLTQVFDRAWLHIDAQDRDRFNDLMSWRALNELLDLRVWTDRTMTMVMDKQTLPASAYCANSADRNHQSVMQPNSGQVMDWCRRGAALVLNEIENLHPAIRQVADILHQALGVRVSANLYCSWAAHQAFDAHYDRHDVFSLQIIGNKRWQVYRGRADQPLEHPMFLNVPQSDYDAQKGPVDQRVVMAPGDLLYLPRGQFHDALAESGPSVHLTFSCNAPNGLDWLNLLWEEALKDREFRRNLPLPKDDRDEVFVQHLLSLGQRFSAMAQDPGLIANLRNMRQHFGAEQPPYQIMTHDQTKD